MIRFWGESFRHYLLSFISWERTRVIPVEHVFKLCVSTSNYLGKKRTLPGRTHALNFYTFIYRMLTQQLQTLRNLKSDNNTILRIQWNWFRWIPRLCLGRLFFFKFNFNDIFLKLNKTLLKFHFKSSIIFSINNINFLNLWTIFNRLKIKIQYLTQSR